MKKATLFKLLFFILVALPLAVFLFSFFIIPLLVVLLIFSIFWSGRVFRFGTFRRKDVGNTFHNGRWQEETSDPDGDYVDVESTVVGSSVMEKEECSGNKELPGALSGEKE